MGKQQPKPVKPMRGYRRQIALIFAENLIAEQREPALIDRILAKKYGCGLHTAAMLREEALRLLLSADESNRRDRFKLMVRAYQRLYSLCLNDKQFTVCKGILDAERKMFGLDTEFVEGGGGMVKNEHDDRSIEDLNYFAEHGEWPDEAAKRKSAETVSTNPLDGLT